MAWPPGIVARSTTIADLPAVDALLCSVEQHDIGPATSPLPGAARPAGFLVRALRAGEERAVFALIDEAFSEWPGRKGSTFEAWQSSWLARPDFDPTLFLVAENEHGELAGALHAIHFPTEGWIQQLAVAPAYRRRGLARALLATSFAELLRRGAPRIGLNTDSRTGALSLYTRLGMNVALSFTNYSKALA